MLNDLKAKPGPNWTSILNDKELLGIIDLILVKILHFTVFFSCLAMKYHIWSFLKIFIFNDFEQKFVISEKIFY
jgi:hypothetical protein